jgi:hypothetical protein
VVVETSRDRQLDRAVAIQYRLWAEVDVRRQQFLDQRAERVRLRQAWDLVAELELLEDVLDVRRKAVQVRLEVGLELLLLAAGLQVSERERRRVVKGLSGACRGA